MLITRLRKKFHAKRQMKGDVVKLIPKKSFPQMLADRHKKFRAKVIADCKVQHYYECLRNIYRSLGKFLRIAREHAAQLDSQRILAENAIRDVQAFKETAQTVLESIYSLEQAKKAVESEAKERVQQIRDLKGRSPKGSTVSPPNEAERNAQANSGHKPKVIMDVEEVNASLKEQGRQRQGELESVYRQNRKSRDGTSSNGQRGPETTQQAQIIRNLANSIDRPESVVAEQAQTMVDCQNVNTEMM